MSHWFLNNNTEDIFNPSARTVWYCMQVQELLGWGVEIGWSLSSSWSWTEDPYGALSPFQLEVAHRHPLW